jgi:uncharacterized membrane protein
MFPTTPRITHRFLTTLAAGLLVLLPVGLAAMILVALFRFSDSILSPLLHRILHLIGDLLNIDWLSGLTIPGLGIVMLVVLLYLTGLTSLSRPGRWVIGLLERGVARLPVIGAIYTGSRTLIQALFRRESAAARRPVLAELQPGQWVVGFLTGETQVETAGTQTQLVTIYIPSTPNLASGSLMLLASDRVRPLALSVDEAMKLIVSGGLTVPPSLH